MSDIITISLNSLSSRKKLKIGDDIFTVRKLGAGEEMDINQIIRKLDNISKRSKGGELSEKDNNLFNELQEQSLQIYANTFDDGGDGSKSMALVRQLSFADRAIINKQLFGTPELETPESTESAAENN